MTLLDDFPGSSTNLFLMSPRGSLVIDMDGADCRLASLHAVASHHGVALDPPEGYEAKETTQKLRFLSFAPQIQTDKNSKTMKTF